MRYATRTWLGVCLAVLFGLTTACGGDEPAEVPTGTIEGTVALEGADTAADVEVTLQPAGTTKITGDDGSFRFESLTVQAYTLEFSLQNYVTTTKEVEVTDGEATTVEVTLQQVNEPPSIDDITVEPEPLEPASEATVTVQASDPNPDELSYSFETTGGYAVKSSEGNEATLTTPDGFDADGSLTVVVTDPDGESARERIALSTVDNNPPAINGITAAPSTLQPGGTATVTANASDVETDELTYKWSAPMDWSIDDETASEIQVTAPDSYDASAVLELTVTDERGVSATASLSLSTVANNGPIISSVTATPQTVPREGEMTLNVSANDPNGDMLTYKWSAPSDWTLSDDTAVQPKLTAPDKAGETATVEVTVSDPDGLEATGSVVVSTTANQAPVISSLLADNTSLSRGGQTDVTVSASDPNGDPLSYSWSVGNADWSISGMGDTATLTAPNQPGSSTMVSVEVSDDAGGTSKSTIVVTTVPNRAPVVASVYANQNPIARGGSSDVTANASDPNGDTLSYTWSVNDADWSISGSGATVTLNAPNTPQASAIVTVEVSDDLGAKTTASTQVGTVSNQAPQISTLPSISGPLAAGRDPFTYQPSANDPDDSNLTWSLKTQPSTNASIDTSTGKVEWMPPRSAATRSYTFEVRVTDGNDTVSQTFTLRVEPFGFRSTNVFSVADNLSPAFGDFDGDGAPELAGETFSNRLSYMLSGARFASESTYSWAGSGGFGTCDFDRAADLDGDGDQDVVSLCENSDTAFELTFVTWLNGINQSSPMGEFGDGSILTTGTGGSITGAGVGDIDGNTGDDLVVADSRERLHVLTSDGSGGLTLAQSVSPSPPAGPAGQYRILDIRVANLDGNAGPEVLALERYEQSGSTKVQAAVYSFDGQGQLQSSRTNSVALNDTPDKINVGDLDGDGAMDFAVKTDGSPVAVETYVNDGSASFSMGGSITSASLCNTSDNRGVAIGQIDNDGHADVVVGTDCTGTVHVAFGDGTGNLTDIRQLGATALSTDETEEVFVGDSNNDGLMDIFAYDFGRLVIYR